MPSAHPLNFCFRAVRRAGARGELGGRSGPPSLCFETPVEAGAAFLYNHVKSDPFFWGWGLFDPGVLTARPIFGPYPLAALLLTTACSLASLSARKSATLLSPAASAGC